MVAIIVINEGLLNSINSNTYYDYDLSVTTVNHHRSEDTTIRFGLTRSPASSPDMHRISLGIVGFERKGGEAVKLSNR